MNAGRREYETTQRTGSSDGPRPIGAGAPASSLYTVGEVADLVGVTVRTLHHWERERVVVPSRRSPAGYRLYSAEDVARLQRALVYRETGMGLADIAEALDSLDAPAQHLRRQRALLVERIARLEAMVDSVDALIDKEEKDMTMSPEERSTILGRDWTEDPYYEEAKDRYGETDDWAESQRRRSARGPEGEAAAAKRLEEVEARIADAMRAGVEPGTEKANALADAHRAALDWFEVTPGKHAILARMYVSDPRFHARYEAVAPGLAEYLKAIIDANALAHGVDPEAAAWA